MKENLTPRGKQTMFCHCPKPVAAKTLDFLSNDRYSFEFHPLVQEQPLQSYLNFAEADEWPFYGVERVVMFSGGLDSLAGAVETAAQGQNLVLVSHRPMATMDRRQRELFHELEELYHGRMIHVPVWINKDKALGREHTQRTRSFLYSALGTVIAASIGAKGVRFFENGVVSLNLPVADEVLRARASRTTHPRALDLFTRLYRLVTDTAFVVDNPFLFKTKAEVVSIIADRGAGHLIKRTCSCAHTGIFQPKTQWHCGTCSQCIDRRIAIIACGLADSEPQDDYLQDVFTGTRRDGYEKNMAVDYVSHAIALHNMSEEDVVARFNSEIARAVRCFPDRRAAAQCLIQMHKRHGETAYSVLKQQLEIHSGDLVEGRLDQTSMLAMVAGQRHRESAWRRYCDQIISLLQMGLPTACRTHKPQNEPHLQELCDGILKAHDHDLVREFPFMRWSSVMTKADWSVEQLNLLVEAKYVRKRADIRPITEDLAADITKYGDNNWRVLYMIYDPGHHITDDTEFVAPLVQRNGMLAHIIR